MQQSKSVEDTAVTGRARDERLRFVLMVLVVAVLALLVFFFSRPALQGKVDPVDHVKIKQQQDLEKRRAEIDRQFKLGLAMLGAKDYDKALTAFHRVLQLNPKMPEAYVNAGYALLGLGEAKAARDFFDSATMLRPNQLNAYFGLAEALEALGDNFGAMQAMETYIHLAKEDDPFRRKAEAAAWELRARLDEEKEAVSAAGPETSPQTNGKPQKSTGKP